MDKPTLEIKNGNEGKSREDAAGSSYLPSSVPLALTLEVLFLPHHVKGNPDELNRRE
jgi:hypothetical protein